MKKSILAALIAATSLVPVAASAQDGRGRGVRGNADQGPQERAPSADRQAMRAARQAERAAQPQQAQQQQQAPQQRQEFRQQQREERQQFRQQAPQVAPQQRQDFRQDQRAERQQFRQQAPAPQAQVDSQRTDRGQFRAERRDDQQGFRQERREDRTNLRNGTVTQPQFRNDRRDDRQDYRADRRDDRQDYRGDRNGGRDWNGGNGWNRGNDRNQGNWNRSWRNDGRYNWQGYRSSNRNAYRLPRYYAPRGYGYGYQRFSIGVTLGSILFAQNYWIDDPWEYRLPEAYGPYRWVRYYNDALLVDIRSGYVVDVINDIFW